VLAEDKRCERTGQPWHVEYRVLAKDGRVVWLRDHAVLVRGEPGEPDYWQGYYIDITEQKQAEEALRQALERERWALERERQAARQLRALDELKNTFLDAVSHELRTPLATVIGIALTLQRAGSSLPEEDTADLVDRLVANAGKLDRLLADIDRVVPDRVGVTGFCMGGGLALMLASKRADKIKAAVPWYGLFAWRVCASTQSVRVSRQWHDTRTAAPRRASSRW
jgi:signal transduction histidine kinase